MLTIQINKHQYEIPTKWDEVTLKQYSEIVLNADDLSPIKLLSILTGIDYDILANFSCSAFSLEAMPEMEWLNEPLNPRTFKRSKTLTIAGKEIKIIHDAGQERFGQKLFMQQLVNKAIESNVNHTLLVAPVVANYYAPYLRDDGKWIESHVNEVQDLIMNMKVCKVYPEADFFLSGYIKFKPMKATS